MCGRYSLVGDISELAMRFDLEVNDLNYRPRYNIAPTQAVLVLTNDGGRRPPICAGALYLSGPRVHPGVSR